MENDKNDPAKQDILRVQRVLNPNPAGVTDELFAENEFFDARDMVQVKYEMVRRVRGNGWPISRASGSYGFSRPSYYEAARALDREGLAGLIPRRPGPKGAHKLTDDVMAFVRALLEQTPGLRHDEVAARVRQRFGTTVHPRSIERALRAGRKKK